MNELDQALATMDFTFFGSGEHSMGVEGLHKALGREGVLFLDVRTRQELACLALPFATHIPLDELPARVDEVPKERCVVTLCSSIFRAAVAYTYLRARGYEEVKAMTAPFEDLVKALKPGPLSNR